MRLDDQFVRRADDRGAPGIILMRFQAYNLRSALSGVPAGGFFQVWSLAGCVSEFVGVCYVCSGLKCN